MNFLLSFCIGAAVGVNNRAGRVGSHMWESSQISMKTGNEAQFLMKTGNEAQISMKTGNEAQISMKTGNEAKKNQMKSKRFFFSRYHYQGGFRPSDGTCALIFRHVNYARDQKGYWAFFYRRGKKLKQTQHGKFFRNPYTYRRNWTPGSVYGGPEGIRSIKVRAGCTFWAYNEDADLLAILSKDSERFEHHDLTSFKCLCEDNRWQWVIAEKEKNCNEKCNNMGLKCTNEYQHDRETEVNTSAKLKKWINLLGGNIPQLSHSSCTTCTEKQKQIAPFFKPDACVFPPSNRDFEDTKCEQEQNQTEETDYERLCYCHGKNRFIYKVGEKGDPSCPHGFKKILNEVECKDAANELGIGKQNPFKIGATGAADEQTCNWCGHCEQGEKARFSKDLGNFDRLICQANCPHGFRLGHGDMCEACNRVPGCTMFEAGGCTCKTCLPGFRLQNGYCEGCSILGCTMFEAGGCNCTTCAPDFELQDGACEEITYRFSKTECEEDSFITSNAECKAAGKKLGVVSPRLEDSEHNSTQKGAKCIYRLYQQENKLYDVGLQVVQDLQDSIYFYVCKSA